MVIAYWKGHEEFADTREITACATIHVAWEWRKLSAHFEIWPDNSEEKLQEIIN